ncbi:MAG: hypothetical protein HYZ39_07745 [Mycolicibacterium cosmeticum]|nr:hypothetical protein [Mycolicibacterium cosmeticum]
MIEQTARRDADVGYPPGEPDGADGYGRHARTRGSAPAFGIVSSTSGPRHAAPEAAAAFQWSLQPRRPKPRHGRRAAIAALVALAVAVPVAFLVMRDPAPIPDPRTPVPTPTTATSAPVAVSTAPPAPPAVPDPVPAQEVPALTVQPTYQARRPEPSRQRKPEIGVTRTPVTRTPISAVAPTPPTTGRNSSTPGDEPGGWGPW